MLGEVKTRVIKSGNNPFSNPHCTQLLSNALTTKRVYPFHGLLFFNIGQQRSLLLSYFVKQGSWSPNPFSQAPLASDPPLFQTFVKKVIRHGKEELHALWLIRDPRQRFSFFLRFFKRIFGGVELKHPLTGRQLAGTSLLLSRQHIVRYSHFIIYIR